MRTIKRYLQRAFADPGWAASVIVGVLVGALVGGGGLRGGGLRAPSPHTLLQPDGTVCTKATVTISKL
jgi:hypothetical protein